MGIGGGETEEGVEPRLESLGEVVLQPLRLVVDLVPAHANRLGQVGLQQAVAADHVERGLPPRLSQRSRRDRARA